MSGKIDDISAAIQRLHKMRHDNNYTIACIPVYNDPYNLEFYTRAAKQCDISVAVINSAYLHRATWLQSIEELDVIIVTNDISEVVLEMLPDKIVFPIRAIEDNPFINLFAFAGFTIEFETI